MNAQFNHVRSVLALFLSGRRRLLYGGALLAAATVVAGMALLGLSGWFIAATALAGLSAAAALAFDVFLPGAAIRLLAIVRTAARYGERLLTHDAALAVLAALRPRLLRGWAGPEAARRLLARPARLLFRLTADVDALDALYLRQLVPLGAALAAALAAGLAVACLVDAALGLSLLGWLLASGAGMVAWTARRGSAPARRRAHAVETLRSRAIDLVTGQTELLMAGRLHAQTEALLRAERRLARADDALHRAETTGGLMQGLAQGAAMAGVLIGCMPLVERGLLSAPLAALALLLTLAAGEPLTPLRRGALELARTLLAVRRIAPRLAEPAPRQPAAIDPAAGVNVRGVPLAHAGADVGQRPVTLAIAPGERIAIVGASGAGKSTLLALLAGELGPLRGTVQAPPSCLLTQRTELFQDTLRHNLRLADPAADDARLWQVLHDAGLAAHVAALPAQLDTRLGEGGLGLSGGQARRLALARLLLRPVRLWLLDEPTEGLDGATARDVLARLAQRAGDRTLVIATHIRREALLADRLLVLRAGAVAADVARSDPGFGVQLRALRPD